MTTKEAIEKLKTLGHSQSDIADMLNVSRSYISKILSDSTDYPPSESLTADLSRLVGCQIIDRVPRKLRRELDQWVAADPARVDRLWELMRTP